MQKNLPFSIFTVALN